MALYGGVPAALDFSLHRNSASHSGPHSGSLPKWDPSTMTEGDLVSEKGHGPVTERLVTALLPAPDMAAWKHVKEAEDLFEARPVASGSHGGTLGKEKMNVADFEERARDTARFHGLLDGEVRPQTVFAICTYCIGRSRHSWTSHKPSMIQYQQLCDRRSDNCVSSSRRTKREKRDLSRSHRTGWHIRSTSSCGSRLTRTSRRRSRSCRRRMARRLARRRRKAT